MGAEYNPLDALCLLLDGSDIADEYCARHNIDSATILTVLDDDRAELRAFVRARGKEAECDLAFWPGRKK